MPRTRNTSFSSDVRANFKDYDVIMMAKALSAKAADILIAKTANVSEAKANSTFSKTVQFLLVDSEGNVHTWYNQTGYTITMTPSAGTLTGSPTGSANAEFINGVCTIVVTGNATCHNNVGANTVVLTAQAINGVTPSGANLTHTITFT